MKVVTLLLAVVLFCIALGDFFDRVDRNDFPPPPHFVPKPPAEAFQHSTPHPMSCACCSAGSCARDHHHVAKISDSFWHEDIEPLANAPDDQNWHVVRDAGGYSWGSQVTTI